MYGMKDINVYINVNDTGRPTNIPIIKHTMPIIRENGKSGIE